jgi:hypothetical protein
MLATLKWFLRWYRQRAGRTKLLIALLILATIMGCLGVLTPPTNLQRRPTPRRPAGSRDSAPSGLVLRTSGIEPLLARGGAAVPILVRLTE